MTNQTSRYVNLINLEDFHKFIDKMVEKQPNEHIKKWVSSHFKKFILSDPVFFKVALPNNLKPSMEASHRAENAFTFQHDALGSTVLSSILPISRNNKIVCVEPKNSLLKPELIQNELGTNFLPKSNLHVTGLVRGVTDAMRTAIDNRAVRPRRARAEPIDDEEYCKEDDCTEDDGTWEAGDLADNNPEVEEEEEQEDDEDGDYEDDEEEDDESETSLQDSVNDYVEDISRPLYKSDVLYPSATRALGNNKNFTDLGDWLLLASQAKAETLNVDYRHLDDENAIATLKEISTRYDLARLQMFLDRDGQDVSPANLPFFIPHVANRSEALRIAEMGKERLQQIGLVPTPKPTKSKKPHSAMKALRKELESQSYYCDFPKWAYERISSGEVLYWFHEDSFKQLLSRDRWNHFADFLNSLNPTEPIVDSPSILLQKFINWSASQINSKVKHISDKGTLPLFTLLGESRETSFTFYKLVTKEAYIAEGKVMRNCIASYSSNSWTMIFSMREAVSGRSRMTIGVDRSRGAIKEAKAKANSQISSEMKRHLQVFAEIFGLSIDTSVMPNSRLNYLMELEKSFEAEIRGEQPKPKSQPKNKKAKKRQDEEEEENREGDRDDGDF